MAATFENSVQKLVDENKIPNTLAYASDAKGDFKYRGVIEHSSPGPDAPVLTEDTYLWAASCTKLLTSIAVMKLVEDGRLALDEVVDNVLPELAKLKIIKQMEPTPEYETPKNKITFRQLLQHTSGLSYDFMHPLLADWRAENPASDETVPSRFGLPLVYEPGTAWAYSCGLDWAGLAVERVADMKLSEFMEKNIFEPAGVEKDAITFFPFDVPGAKLATMTGRAEDDTFKLWDGMNLDPPKQDCYGGQGTYFRGDAYLRVLRALLADDEKLLKRASVVEMLRPQLDAAQKKAINDLVYSDPQMTRIMARQIPEGKLDHSLAGVVDLEGQSGWRGKGTVMWGGAPNHNWFLDPEKGLCGILEAQLMPTGDPIYVEVTKDFEKTMYELTGKTS